MWFTRAIRLDRAVVAASTASMASTVLTGSSPQSSRYPHYPSYNIVQCEGSSSEEHRMRRRATVNKANSRALKRTSTREELSKLRSMETEILERWERDEDGWRTLPARAWPEFQPKPEQLPAIQAEMDKNDCSQKTKQQTDLCQSLLFNVATGLVFYNVDSQRGFQQYETLAKQGHVDSMVACGVILVESFGGYRNREAEGIQWLQKAVTLGSTQAQYELGTVYYTGIDEVLEDDPEKAFALFEQAAIQGHVGAMYMMADCLIEGDGTEKDVAKAVPLLYLAADEGHRYARQRVRELLSIQAYQN